MERKILNWVTGCLGVITLLVCACLYFLPNIKQTLVLAAEIATDVKVQEMDIQIQENETVGREQKQLNIELPENTEGKDISIINDYFTQTVYVRFAHGVDNYSDHYVIRGSSNHISNLSYYKEGEAGVLEIALDKICEIAYSYKEGFLCLVCVRRGMAER